MDLLYVSILLNCHKLNSISNVYYKPHVVLKDVLCIAQNP